MELKWDDIVVDKRAVRADAADLIADWLWLIPVDAEPMLPTACGDLFLRCPDGSIAFLDTYAPSWRVVAPSYDNWKARLDAPDPEWFKVDLVADLLDAGLTREVAQCFSPLVPQAIGGSWEPSNFHPCELIVHLSTLGQIHQQVKDLPPGTPISNLNVKWD